MVTINEKTLVKEPNRHSRSALASFTNGMVTIDEKVLVKKRNHHSRSALASFTKEMVPIDEKTLVKKLNRHSRTALEYTVRQFTPYVYTVICNTLSGRACREDAEELAADVFLTLWNHAGELDSNQGLRPWLATVARNKATDWLRLHRTCDPLPENIPDTAGDPEKQTEQREWAARLWSAVNSLPEPDKTLFLRYYYQEEKLKTIAQELGLKQSAAKHRLFRGRKALKAMLSEGGTM